MDSIFVALNGKIDGLSKKIAYLLSFLALLLAVGFIIGSFYLIEIVEMLGVLSGSLGGVMLLLGILISTRAIFSDRTTKDFRHNFALTTRRKIAAGIAVAAILTAGVLSNGENPVVGALLIVLIGLLSIFVSTTQDEKDAIESMEEEILWSYENEESEGRD